MKIRNTFSIRIVLGALVVALLFTATAATNAQPDQSSHPFGDVRALAAVPASTGFPEGIAVKGNRV